MLLGVVPVVLALLSLWNPSFVWLMVAVDALIFAVALLDAFWARKPLIRVRRTLATVLSNGQENPVELRIWSDSKRQLQVRINDTIFDHATAPQLPLAVTVPSLGKLSVKYMLRPTRRGSYSLGDHYVRYPSPLGLWQRQLRIEATDEVKVYPDIEAVRAFELLARQSREQAFTRSSRRLGGESEFERLREYQREDEYRSIDWKATARRGRLIARQYQLESNQNVIMAIDGGRLMTAVSDGLSLFDHALNACLLLSHMVVRNGDRVGLLSFASEVTGFSALRSGARATQSIIETAYRLHPELVESDFNKAFDFLAQRVRRRTLVVLFTQVVDEVAAEELATLARGLMPRHLVLVVLLRDVDVDALIEPSGTPPREADVAIRAAAAEALSWRRNVVRRLENLGALVLHSTPSTMTAPLLNRYLEIKARHLL